MSLVLACTPQQAQEEPALFFFFKEEKETQACPSLPSQPSEFNPIFTPQGLE